MIRMSMLLLFLAVFAPKDIPEVELRPVFSPSEHFYAATFESSVLTWISMSAMDQDDDGAHSCAPLPSFPELLSALCSTRSEGFTFHVHASQLFFRRWLVFCQLLN